MFLKAQGARGGSEEAEAELWREGSPWAEDSRSSRKEVAGLWNAVCKENFFKSNLTLEAGSVKKQKSFPENNPFHGCKAPFFHSLVFMGVFLKRVHLTRKTPKPADMKRPACTSSLAHAPVQPAWVFSHCSVQFRLKHMFKSLLPLQCLFAGLSSATTS